MLPRSVDRPRFFVYNDAGAKAYHDARAVSLPVPDCAAAVLILPGAKLRIRKKDGAPSRSREVRDRPYVTPDHARRIVWAEWENRKTRHIRLFIAYAEIGRIGS